MAKRNLSQAEINARKKVQAASWRTTGALGLAGLGTFGASKVPGSARITRAIPSAKKLNARKLENATVGLGAAGGGVGGVSSFNSAAISAAEARQKKVPVKKSAFGVEHVDIAKAASDRRPNPERKAAIKASGERHDKRQGAISAAGITGIYGGYAARVAGGNKLKTAVKQKQSGEGATALKTARSAGKLHRGGGRVAVGSGVGLVGGSIANARHTVKEQAEIKRVHPATIKKNAVSAFGVVH